MKLEKIAEVEGAFGMPVDSVLESLGGAIELIRDFKKKNEILARQLAHSLSVSEHRKANLLKISCELGRIKDERDEWKRRYKYGVCANCGF
jgi:hypothetical protein